MVSVTQQLVFEIGNVIWQGAVSWSHDDIAFSSCYGVCDVATGQSKACRLFRMAALFSPSIFLL
jgi:hypothetical protein